MNGARAATSLTAISVAAVLPIAAMSHGMSVSPEPSYGLTDTTPTDRRQAIQEAPARPAVAAPVNVALWQLVICQLDPLQHGYSTNELAPLLNINRKQVSSWCKRLFGAAQGKREVYWLSFAQVVKLTRKVCAEGRNKAERDDLYRKLLLNGSITDGFPSDNFAVQIAEGLLAQEREVLLRKAR